MEPNYLIVVNYYDGSVIIIKLTEDEKANSVVYDDFEAFIRAELEDAYNFRLDDCYWMTTEHLKVSKFNFE